jgi:hypothetical protein
MTVKKLKEILSKYDDKLNICLIPEEDETFPNFTFDFCINKPSVEEYCDMGYVLLPIKVDLPY